MTRAILLRIFVGAAAVFIITLFVAYGTIFGRRHGYLIDNLTNRVFRIELAKDVQHCEPWELFVPIYGCSSTRIIDAKGIGELRDLLKRSELKASLANSGRVADLDRLLEAEMNSSTNTILHDAWILQTIECHSMTQTTLQPDSATLAFLKEEITRNPKDFTQANCALWTYSVPAKVEGIEPLGMTMILQGSVARQFGRKIH